MRRLADIPLLRPTDAFALTGHQLRRAAVPIPDEVEPEWPLVVALRRRVSDEVTREAEAHGERAGVPMRDDDRRLMARAVINRVVHAHAEQQSLLGELWTIEREQRYCEALEAAIFGFGRLQPLFELPDVENIEIHGYDSVVAQYGDGHREHLPPVAESDGELVEAIRFLGESVNPPRPFDDSHPTMTLALGDRHRLHAIGFGLSYRPSITIRQHILTAIDLPELVDRGMMPDDVGRLLHAAVLARTSIVIAGDQGAGKTTLLRALIASIPHNERFGTLETDYELLTHLQPGRRNMLALQARVGLGEVADGRQVGEFSVAQLIPEALRQNLSRLVVGEVRGAEAGAMFEAMTSGAGTMSTTHSHSAASTMDRLAGRVAQGGVLTVDEAYRQIALHIRLIVYVRLVDETWRGGVRTREVSQVLSLNGATEGNRPVAHVLYQAAGPHDQGRFHPEPWLLDELAPFLPDWRAR
ncbi:MAG: CpaF family protein [Actinomycetes bacterium]